jgi:tetratricopeptide (TPR) repeat protein
MVENFNDIHRQVKRGHRDRQKGCMTMQEGLRALGEGAADRQRQDRAYFLDLLGDSQGGLGRHEAAIDAYRQAAQAFEAQGARCSYALCLLKIADSYLSLHEPWNAIGYLEACLPLLRELGLTRHFSLAQGQLTGCQAKLAQVGLLGEGRAGPRREERGRPVRPGQPRRHRRPGQHHCRRARGRLQTCPVQTASRTG